MLNLGEKMDIIQEVNLNKRIVKELNQKLSPHNIKIEVERGVEPDEEGGLIEIRNPSTGERTIPVYTLIKEGQIIGRELDLCDLMDRIRSLFGKNFILENDLDNQKWELQLLELEEKLAPHKIRIEVERNVDPDNEGGLIDLRNLEEGQKTFSVYTLYKDNEIIGRETNISYLMDKIQSQSEELESQK